ncbi:TPA: AAA family ATPase, partial [Escherichia coli]|nr:AAA family ATPase [Escherichia coli]
MSPQNNHLQRPPAAVLYADELAKLKQNDTAPCPPGWQLSLPAARAFILGDSAQNISRKVVISPSAVERMLVTLATGRGLMLVGEPGTAKSLLSELLATAISGDAGLTIQGGASTTEDQIKYGWNYALLINHGPSTEALVPAPLYQGMRDGKIVRFEEITRTPLEVQDCLLGMLSDRVMTVPELTGEASQLYAREGF